MSEVVIKYAGEHEVATVTDEVAKVIPISIDLRRVFFNIRRNMGNVNIAFLDTIHPSEILKSICLNTKSEIFYLDFSTITQDQSPYAVESIEEAKSKVESITVVWIDQNTPEKFFEVLNKRREVIFQQSGRLILLASENTTRLQTISTDFYTWRN